MSESTTERRPTRRGLLRRYATRWMSPEAYYLCRGYGFMFLGVICIGIAYSTDSPGFAAGSATALAVGMLLMPLGYTLNDLDDKWECKRCGGRYYGSEGGLCGDCESEGGQTP